MGVYGMSEDESVERLSVAEAAERLGVTRDAIHKRIARGSIRHEKGEDGRLHVYVETSTTEADTSTDASTDRTDLLIAELQDRVRSLEEANRENRRIIAALTQRIPAIEAPAETPSQEPPESPAAATEQPGRVELQAQVEGAQEPAEQVSWWRRVLGV
jgi:excisionase family DNA binding protein